MKWIIPLVMIVLASCSSSRYSSQTNFYAIDFRPYVKKGFFISPYSWTGDYTPVSQVALVMTPEAAYVGGEGPGGLPKGTYMSGDYMVQEISIQDALDSMYNYCLQIGADALVDFDYRIEDEPLFVNGPTIPRITVSGFAIKRE